MPVSNRADQANHPSAFQRFVLPGLAFKAVVIGGGYATGREIAEFFVPAGPWGGIAAMAVATVIWCVVCATTFVFARRLRERDYRSFFRALLGRAWPIFEIAYVLFVVLILAVFGAAAGAIAAATFGAPPIVGTLCLMAAIALCWHSATRASNAYSRGCPCCSTVFTPRSWYSPSRRSAAAFRKPSHLQTAGMTDGCRVA